MPNKRITTAIIAVVLVVGIGVGASLAYLTDREDVNIDYMVGAVEVSLTGEHVGEMESGLLPGRAFAKKPQVQLGANSEACYVRIEVSYPSAEDLAYIMSVPKPNSNDGWIMRADRSKPNTYYYYYMGSILSNKALNGQNAITLTPPAFNEVVVAGKNPGAETGVNHMDLIEKADQQSMQILAQAIQAEGLPDDLSINDIVDIFERYY